MKGGCSDAFQDGLSEAGQRSDYDKSHNGPICVALVQPCRLMLPLAEIPNHREFEMDKHWCEPKLDDLLSDPILDVLLTCDRVTRDELDRVIEQARQTLARVPREWHLGEPTGA